MKSDLPNCTHHVTARPTQVNSNVAYDTKENHAEKSNLMHVLFHDLCHPHIRGRFQHSLLPLRMKSLCPLALGSALNQGLHKTFQIGHHFTSEHLQYCCICLVMKVSGVDRHGFGPLPLVVSLIYPLLEYLLRVEIMNPRILLGSISPDDIRHPGAERLDLSCPTSPDRRYGEGEQLRSRVSDVIYVVAPLQQCSILPAV